MTFKLGFGCRLALTSLLLIGAGNAAESFVANEYSNDVFWPLGECPDRSRVAGIADGRAKSAADQLTPFRTTGGNGCFCRNQPIPHR
ncbi:hypothetical protein [Novosphingobium sp.]|uniref:hypothetical protein n=1 Tax=Novosphingobium sp. TaxID=1874826 RepID=UPI0028A8BE63|nr:hypothetical protein [Novosphingobium sp.]